ncbi:hypothetical protein GGD65_007812 [Bradyrhizobium sp. CIR18]|nr:hypothetical protein [Bradyrhizobium sp. CIR18]
MSVWGQNRRSKGLQTDSDLHSAADHRSSIWQHRATSRPVARQQLAALFYPIASTASLAFFSSGLYLTGRRDLQLLDQQQPALLIAIVRIYSCEQPFSLD